MKKTFIYRDGRLLEKKSAAQKTGLQIIPDLKPYHSMITGEMIDGRTAHRHHLRQHGCIEVGN
jgi:hypothetical protein